MESILQKDLGYIEDDIDDKIDFLNHYPDTMKRDLKKEWRGDLSRFDDLDRA